MISSSRIQLASLIRGSSITTKHIRNTHLSTMATARKIQITPDNTGLWHQKQTEAAAKKTTELLQDDLEKHHCFFNMEGYHNHISHHLLSLYGLGASPEHIQQGYNDNANYQRTPFKTHSDIQEELKDFATAKDKYGKEEYYTDFLVFFQNEIDKKGWKEVLLEYMFKGDEQSENMLVRMFAGFLHPIIQLMYGIEWQQPAIIAMGLAQAAVHPDKVRRFIDASERAASQTTSSSSPMPEIATLFDEVAADAKVGTAARWSDENKVHDGVLGRAFDDLVRIAGKVRVKPEELDARTAEMYNTITYYTTGAALRKGKEPRYDFFLIHHVNVCPIFIAINAQEWIPTAAKVRLLEWKIRFDLLQYAARGCAPAFLDDITSYVPKEKTQKSTTDLLPRVHAWHDDGHAPKLIRAVGVCQQVCAPYEASGEKWLKLRGDDVWTKVNQLIVDAVEGDGPKWVRSAGHEGAWTEIPDRQV
ncbi:HypA protein [Nemania sp. FL0916]|nr:HypA protein [Nemania sp. FL0916]